MIDINNIVNTAIQQAINSAITNYVDAYMANVQQEHRRQIAELREEITALKGQPTANLDNPAVGTDTTLARDVKTLLENDAAIKQAVYEIAYSAAESVMNDHTETYDHDSYDSATSAVEDANLDSLPDFDDFLTRDDLENAIRDTICIDDYVKEEEMHDAIEEKINDLVEVDTLVTKDDMFQAVRNEVRDALENRTSVSITLS